MTKNKAPPEQASMFGAFEQAETEQRTSHLPGDIGTAGPYLLSLFRDLNAAIIAGDKATYERLTAEAHDLAVKLNGGTHFGMCVDDGGASQLERATRAPDGQVPLWGQQGVFDIEACGCRVRIDFDGIYGTAFPGFSANAIDWDKPFISETGYRSFLLATGLDVEGGFPPPDQFAREVIEARAAKELKGKLLPIQDRYRERHAKPDEEPQP